ncbi:ABC transporter related [Staphylothermus marinus F1]|uniref:ABC transporter related n=1 Tax=Staphylothermus marinus (strain ATCC 43588 / DSM 3639 / JCM 9404 / F1) TaxID=399550 RepID=A3DKJ3_STAMF|nr:ATP-binding cassette domain-containing protein [Staphylothermus marinus]ABN69153.1 ABC transporter related [Staphylothermus marinus F1]
MANILINNVRIKLDEQIIIPENLEVHEPSQNLYVGKTGAGKTILLKTLSGIAPDLYNIVIEGEIVVDGKNYYIPQEPWIINVGKTGIEELIYTIYYTNKKNTSLFKQLDQHKYMLTKRISDMSYGERRVLEILKTIIYDPDIVFFDEPFEALDPRNKVMVSELLKELVSHGKIIIATAKTRLDGWKTYRINSIKKRQINIDDLEQIDPQSSGRGKITIKNAYIRRGKRKIYIPQIDLRPGGSITIIGSNGAGKTSILLGISGVLKIHGYHEIKGNIGFVPDDVSMIFSWSDTETVIKELCSSNDDCYRSSIRILKNLGIKIEDRFFYEHSDGEKRLIILIPQLMKNPDILLIDGGLEYIDYEKAKVVEELIYKFLNSGGIVVSTLPSGEELHVIEGLHLSTP